MTPFTPTTADVSAGYARDSEEVAEFDRWLVLHDREVAKAALETYADALANNGSARSWDRDTYVADVRDWAANAVGV